MDDAVFFACGSQWDLISLKWVLYLFYKSISMVINLEKYCLIPWHLYDMSLRQAEYLLPFPRKELDLGFKYMIFFLKLNDYKFNDWKWLVKINLACMSHSKNWLLSRGG
jgi:hypothetical protein